MDVSMGFGTCMLNCGYFFKETLSRAKEEVGMVKIREKIKKARQGGRGEKSFAMQMSMFWGNGLSFHKKSR